MLGELRDDTLDYHCSACHDYPHRSPTQFFNQCLWTNHLQSQRDSVAGNAFIELLVVLPVLVFLLFGIMTAASLAMANYAAGQAAENAAFGWASGLSETAASNIARQTMSQDGYNPGSIRTHFLQSGILDTVEVSTPIYLWALARTGQVSVTRSIQPAPASSPVTSSGQGTGGGGTIIVLHHFPMW